MSLKNLLNYEANAVTRMPTSGCGPEAEMRWERKEAMLSGAESVQCIGEKVWVKAARKVTWIDIYDWEML